MAASLIPQSPFIEHVHDIPYLTNQGGINWAITQKPRPPPIANVAHNIFATTDRTRWATPFLGELVVINT